MRPLISAALPPRYKSGRNLCFLKADALAYLLETSDEQRTGR